MRLPLVEAAGRLPLAELPFPHIDPVALDLPGPIDLRWYGLSYLAAFAVGYVVLRRLARNGFLKLDAEKVGDLLFALILGTILGGRLGYILFYEAGEYLANPARIIRIWEGGLSFHGGLIGVLVAAAWFVRREAASFRNLGDALALGVPIGIFFVRMANFVNGELYGRVTDASVPWAMRFPTDPAALRLLGYTGGPMRERELLVQEAYASGRWDAIRDQVPLRHPSQLYEAFLEGLLLAAILWLLYRLAWTRGRRLAPGTYGGVFLLGYGLFRSLVELFRQPDQQFTSATDPLGTVLGPLTMGQLLSLGMIAVGTWFVVRAVRAGPLPPDPPSAAARKP